MLCISIVMYNGVDMFVFNFFVYECSYTIACKSDECEWMMKAFVINKSGMFHIRMFNMDHTCPLKNRVYSQM